MSARPGPGGETREATRRRFLLALGTGLAGLGALLLAAPLLGPLISSAWRASGRRKWVSVAPVDAFPRGQTRLASYRNPFTVPWDGETGEIACWVRRRDDGSFQVFSVHCTHLGCPVRWFAGSGLFLCPCHGGVFYADGRRAAGPPPRGLYRYEHRVRDGALQVRGGHVPSLAEPL
jgi:quinol---cytochrome c reductase iron-sulfur subunit, bacillus type